MVDSVKYLVCIDSDENLVSVHSTACLVYQDSKHNGLSGVLWLGPFKTFEEACFISEQYTDNLGCCKKCISLISQEILALGKPKLKNN